MPASARRWQPRGPAPGRARFMRFVRNPYRGQLAGAMQPRQAHGIAAVGLDPVARPLRHQRRGDHHALMAERDDLAIKTVAGRAGLVANSNSPCRLASLATRRRTASGALSMSPRKRTSPGGRLRRRRRRSSVSRYPDRRTLRYSAAWLVPCAGGSAPAHPAQSSQSHSVDEPPPPATNIRSAAPIRRGSSRPSRRPGPLWP